jgi:hypothetical protein
MAETSQQARGERFRSLPPAPDPATLRTTQDVDPPPPEEDDAYRELLWVVNRYG